MVLRRSTSASLAAPDAFLWLTGIEDTFITAPWPKTGRTLDEYELTGHYDRWREDLSLMAQLGIKAARYGVPWHRLNPARDQWDWSFADQTLEYLLELGIQPIVDLVHYGLPPWIDNAFLHPDFPHYMADYASRLAERFKGRIFTYTPLNEPRITAWYSGKLGWWPPQRRGWSGFTSVLKAVCRGMVETTRALEQIDSEILPLHVDATDLFETTDPALELEAQHRQEIVFLALDLVSGRVNEHHPLHAWLRKQGFTQTDFDWFQENALELPIIGINLYPMFSRKVLSRSAQGLRARMPHAGAEIVEKLARLYWNRYSAPVFIAETASVGSVQRRLDWLRNSVASVRSARAAGVPLVGYTWWPMFALVTWAWRQGAHPPAYYLKQMGLWDLDPELNRLPTPLIEEYQRFVSGGSAAAGPLLAPTDQFRR